MNIEIIKVDNKALKKQFISFPHKLYAGDPNYVPELSLAISELLSEKKNPFFRHSEAQLFIAKRGGNIVGRIAGILNNNYNQYHQSNVGFFGFFDVIEDQQVAQALLSAAEKHLKEKNVDSIIGPTNFTTNDTAGVLVDGYDKPPVYGMTYNKPYYEKLILDFGFKKEMDLFAYFIPTQGVNEKSLKMADLLVERLARKGITIRKMTKSSMNNDLIEIKRVYRSAWEKNWGFVPPTDEEFDTLADGLKMIIDYDFVYMVEKGNQCIGFGAGIPDINEIVKDFKNGSLFPFNIFKLLFKKKKVSVTRIILLGVIEEFRLQGIAPLIFAQFIKNAKTRGLKGGEASWILENNDMMVKGAENLNGQKYKTYRLYRKKVES